MKYEPRHSNNNNNEEESSFDLDDLEEDRGQLVRDSQAKYKKLLREEKELQEAKEFFRQREEEEKRRRFEQRQLALRPPSSSREQLFKKMILNENPKSEQDLIERYRFQQYLMQRAAAAKEGQQQQQQNEKYLVDVGPVAGSYDRQFQHQCHRHRTSSSRRSSPAPQNEQKDEKFVYVQTRTVSRKEMRKMQKQRDRTTSPRGLAARPTVAFFNGTNEIYRRGYAEIYGNRKRDHMELCPKNFTHVFHYFCDYLEDKKKKNNNYEEDLMLKYGEPLPMWQ